MTLYFTKYKIMHCPPAPNARDAILTVGNLKTGIEKNKRKEKKKL